MVKARRFGGIRLMVIFCSVVTGVVFMLCKPFHPVELFLGLFAAGLLLALLWIYLRKNARHAAAQPASQESHEMSQVMVRHSLIAPRFSWPEWKQALMVAALLANGLIIVNRCADTRPTHTVRAVVLDKYIYHHRGVTEYTVRVHIPVASPVPFTLSDRQEFALADYHNYLTVVAGASVLEFEVHPGFLGFPWYDRHYRLFTPSSPKTTTIIDGQYE